MSDNTPVFDPSTIKLEDIKIIQVKIDNPNSVSSLPESDELDIKFELMPGYNPEIKRLRMIFRSDTSSKKLPEIKASFEAHYFFTVENVEQWVTPMNDNTSIDINDLLMASLVNITYSTSRGIIYARSLGTLLDKLILPVMSTPKLLEPFIPKSTE
jgi:hypothetical protein